jgi:hypothetical protein
VASDRAVDDTAGCMSLSNGFIHFLRWEGVEYCDGEEGVGQSHRYPPHTVVGLLPHRRRCAETLISSARARRIWPQPLQRRQESRTNKWVVQVAQSF